MPSRELEALQSLVGTSVVTTEGLAVEAGKVEEFARSIKDDDLAYRDDEVAAERGYEAVPAPLTFTRTKLFPRYRPEGADDYHGFDLGFDPRHTVHGEQRYEFERPLYVGDVLTGTTTLADVFQQEGSRGGTMTFAVLETEYADDDGSPVLYEETTIIETDGAIAEDDDA